ncbi:hypothetical protein PHSY_001788 [Pseudozyma hubeiensis SY62]|uniref:2,5-diamino-6-ribosylamino-4(3H)-pyrimidinone 5'-phosphate reductase n=1 Tax=Pseudozyma hubeiensis (strain SY62) TaxID=1305764 RepID=R9NZQ2_PSEHS|nr:hypothetical protein PHSY_001788 [Pseudozyma hubeiensis SY62]GAC94217.1 hypothetical protein PHSY_001788 [Pseudozyma hubeiensis SY62]
MSPTEAEETQASRFLHENLRFSTSDRQPHVTLTFAQSQDGKIAGPGKAQMALSGPESMLLTHQLRTLHDGIMVGIGTVLNDNPQLNARLLSPPPPTSELPRPIVLDSRLRMPTDCKLIRNYGAGIGRKPLVLTSGTVDPQRQAQLEEAGVEVMKLHDNSSAELLDWTTILRVIHQAGIRRLMVEGGAAVIDSLMKQPQLIDALLVTIAPVTVGEDGFGFTSELPAVLEKEDDSNWTAPSQAKFGKDSVVLWRSRHVCEPRQDS